MRGHHGSRKQYVDYRIDILADMCLPAPSREEYKRLLDEKRTTDMEVDAYFRDCMMKDT